MRLSGGTLANSLRASESSKKSNGDDIPWRVQIALVIIIVVAVAALPMAVVSRLRRYAAEKNRSAAHAADSRVAPLDADQAAQAGAAVVELVPTGAVKTSRLVTSRDSEGNTIVEEREVAANHAAGVAHLPQGAILRRTEA